MLESLYWRDGPRLPEARVELSEMRYNGLRMFLVVVAVQYAIWHHYFFSLAAAAYPSAWWRAFAILPVATSVLVATYLLSSHNPARAANVFVVGGLVTITWSLYILDTPEVAIVYALLALITAFVIHPLGGFLVVGAGVGILAVFATLRPGVATVEDLWRVAIFGSLAVFGVWMLTRHLFIALTWYAESYVRAERRTREAEEHRAQLIQAWRQLDIANYRLQRTNAALQLAWRAAYEAERSKTELAVNLSHELRTPLNLIAGYAEMMMTSPDTYGNVPLPMEYRGDVYAVYCSAQHLLELTDDILDLGRMEIGKLGLLREPVELHQVIRETVSLVKDFTELRGIDLQVNLDELVPLLMIDRLRIRQVVLNLLINAARFTEKGRIEIHVVRRDADVHVSIADTGPGIAPEDLPHVFQRFVSRGGSREEFQRGTGLGLPISKWFIELHGGEMGVESTLGSGTTFWFTLPLEPAEGHASVEKAAAPRTASPEVREQVLVVVCDDPASARLFQRHLGGYTFEVVSNLAEAEARAIELKATAILTNLDASAPLNGIVPVIQCPFPSAPEVTKYPTVVQYLVKPISREALLAAIRRVDRPVHQVLIADDDPGFVRLLRRMLGTGASGYQIAIAHNGQEVLATMRANPPDLLILDLAMPVLDGFQVLRQMADDAVLAHLPVIVVSAYAEGEPTTPLGSELRISKPEGFRLAELTQVVGAMLSAIAPVRAYLPGTA